MTNSIELQVQDDQDNNKLVKLPDNTFQEKVKYYAKVALGIQKNRNKIDSIFNQIETQILFRQFIENSIKKYERNYGQELKSHTEHLKTALNSPEDFAKYYENIIINFPIYYNGDHTYTDNSAYEESSKFLKELEKVSNNEINSKIVMTLAFIQLAALTSIPLSLLSGIKARLVHLQRRFWEDLCQYYLKHPNATFSNIAYKQKWIVEFLEKIKQDPNTLNVYSKASKSFAITAGALLAFGMFMYVLENMVSAGTQTYYMNKIINESKAKSKDSNNITV